jgi:hypothetical protein
MKPETWIAIYAAIVGTGALLLNFKNWLDSGARLFVTMIPQGMVIGGGPEVDEKGLIIINVTNRGAATTMITGLTLHEFPTLISRWRDRPTKSYVVANPQLLGRPPNVPSDIEQNKSWTGIIRERLDLIPALRSGTVYVGVHASHRIKPYMLRIPKPKPKSADTKEV